MFTIITRPTQPLGEFRNEHQTKYGRRGLANSGRDRNSCERERERDTERGVFSLGEKLPVLQVGGQEQRRHHLSSVFGLGRRKGNISLHGSVAGPVTDLQLFWKVVT